MAVQAAIKLATRGGEGIAPAAGSTAAGLEKLGGILDKILKAIKPITDILGFLLAITFQFVLKSIRLLAKIGKGIFDTGRLIGEKLRKFIVEKVIPKLIELKEKFIEWIKALPGRIWDFLKALPGKIWDFIKTGFTWLKEKFDILKDKLIAGFKLVKERAIALWKLAKEKLSQLWTSIKNLAGLIWDKLKAGFKWISDKVKDVWDSIKELPGKIWDKIKGLAGLIADKLKGVFSFGRGVDDAIIKPSGEIIKTDPADTIIATKTPGVIGGNKIFNFYGLTWPEAMEQVKRELGIDSFGQGRF